VAGGKRQLHNEEVHNLYSLPDITRFTKLRAMTWLRHVAHMKENKSAYNV
jgi:hypothetical protein